VANYRGIDLQQFVCNVANDWIKKRLEWRPRRSHGLVPRCPLPFRRSLASPQTRWQPWFGPVATCGRQWPAAVWVIIRMPCSSHVWCGDRERDDWPGAWVPSLFRSKEKLQTKWHLWFRPVAKMRKQGHEAVCVQFRKCVAQSTFGVASEKLAWFWAEVPIPFTLIPRGAPRQGGIAGLDLWQNAEGRGL
jgi:hypothetical protein